MRYDGLDRPVRVLRAAGFDSVDELTTTTYHPGGQVESQTNANQAQTFYTLDGLNRVTRTDTYFGNEHLVTETEYDGNGNKTVETDRRGVRRRLDYDRLNRLTRVQIEAGPSAGPTGEIATYGYDKVGNKLFETDPAGQKTDFEYDGLYNVRLKQLPEGPGGPLRYEERYRNDKVGNRLSFIDANNHETTFQYDGLNRLTRTVRDPGAGKLNLVSTVTYADPEDTGSKVNKAEEFDGQRALRTLYEYDPLNRETKRRVPLEGEDGDEATGVVEYLTETTYADADHEMTVKDPRGNLTVLRMDKLDRVVVQTVDPDGLNLVTETSYDGLGNKRRVVDPRRNDTLYASDGLGRLVFMQDAERKVGRYEYDGGGLRTAETDRRQVRKDMSYDNLGRLVRTTLAPSKTGVPWSQATEYRDRDLKRIVTDARGFSTTFDLDRMGRVVKETDPETHSKTTGWDGVNKVRESDKRGNVTTFVYDAINRLRRTTDPAPFATQTVVLTYDDAKNRVTEVDPRGLTRISQLDSLGRLRSLERSGVVLERHEYDGNGNRTLTRDAEHHATRYEYDAANRVSRKVEGADSPVEGAATFKYDPNGNVLEERDARAASLGAPWSVKRTFDRLNRLQTETDGEGHEHAYGYDAEGNRTSVKEPLGQTTTYDYDELGKLTRVAQPGNHVTAYGYDPARNRTRQTDANGHVVAMSYDPLNRLETLTQDPGGLELTVRHKYDEDGREELLTDAKGQTTTSRYDELGRLKTRTFGFAPGDPVRPWRHTTEARYAYDENDNVRRIEDDVASGSDLLTLVTSRDWDDQDRLKSETSTLPDGSTRTVKFSYYGNGLRETVVDPAGLITQYGYDARNRTQTATTGFGTPAAATTSYTYHPDSLLHEVLYPNGVKATHAYDRADRLTRLTNLRGPSTVSAYGYTYDLNGNRLSQIETNGGQTETTTYTYDDLDRLASVRYPTDASYPNGRVVTYGYDAVGNRIRETEKDSTEAVLADRQGVFDNANRLTELTDLLVPANTTTFTWDPNGNQLTKTTAGITTENRYDLRDKLVEVVQGGPTLGRFQYDAQGRRTLKIGEDGLRQYVYDQTSLLAEYDESGNQKAKYDYGSDRLVSLTRADEGRRYFSLDGLRSVVNLTNDSGSAVASYHLDPWGNFRFPIELETSKNRFAFTGHIWDSETGLYNAKARYFDPKLGRFLTQDSYLGQIDEPPSLHRYFYAHANPTRYADPTGHCVGFLDICDAAAAWAVDKTRNINFAGGFANTSVGQGVNFGLHAGIEFAGNAALLPGNIRRGIEGLLTPGSRSDGGFESLARTNQIQALKQARASDSYLEKAYLTTAALASQPAVVLEEGILEPFIQVPTQARNVGSASYHAYESAESGDYVGATVHALEAVKEGSAAFGTLGGLAAGGRSLVATAESAPAAAAHPGALAATSSELSEASIMRALRQSKTIEGAATAKMLKRGKVTLELTDQLPGRQIGRQAFGSDVLEVASNKGLTPETAAGVTGHESRHWLQKLDPKSYSKFHELEAYRWQRRIDPSFALQTDTEVRQFLDWGTPIYRGVPWRGIDQPWPAQPVTPRPIP